MIRSRHRVGELRLSCFGIRRKIISVLYQVEMEGEAGWSTTADAVEASSHHQAVVRGSGDAGLYRVREHGDEEHLYFDVPDWGSPEPLPSV